MVKRRKTDKRDGLNERMTKYEMRQELRKR